MRSARQVNRRYFRKAYRSGEHGWPITEPSPFVLESLRRLRRLVPQGHVLDLGCGEGRHAIASAKFGFNVTAVDNEPLALERARRLAKAGGVEGIVFRRGDALDLPFPDERFDIVIDYGCLHHQRKADWRRYVAGVLRVLKPRGFVILSVFSPRFHLFSKTRRTWGIAGGAYRRCFRRQDIEGLFGSRFKILRITEEKEGGFWWVLMRRRQRPTALKR